MYNVANIKEYDLKYEETKPADKLNVQLSYLLGCKVSSWQTISSVQVKHIAMNSYRAIKETNL